MPILMKNIRVQGIFVGSRAMFESMNRAIETAGLHPVVDRVFAFDQAPQALKYLESGAHFRENRHPDLARRNTVSMPRTEMTRARRGSPDPADSPDRQVSRFTACLRRQGSAQLLGSSAPSRPRD